MSSEPLKTSDENETVNNSGSYFYGALVVPYMHVCKLANVIRLINFNHFLGSGDSGSRSRYFAVDGRWYVCILSGAPTEIQLQGQGCLFPAHRSAAPAVVVHAHAAVIRTCLIML